MPGSLLVSKSFFDKEMVVYFRLSGDRKFSGEVHNYVFALRNSDDQKNNGSGMMRNSSGRKQEHRNSAGMKK